MKSITLFLVTAIWMNTCVTVAGQERNQADVSVSSVTLNSAVIARPSSINKQDIAPVVVPDNKNARLASPNNLKCSITVHNENDDDAYETVLVAVLPVEVSAMALPPNATVHKSTPNSPFAGYITFNLGHMTVGQNMTVEFTFTKSKFGNKVGAYAFSGTPDPNPGNNYKEASF